MSLIRSSSAPENGRGQSHWFVFSGREMIVPQNDEIGPVVVPYGEVPFAVDSSEYLGADGDIHYFAADVNSIELDETQYKTINLRNDYKVISSELFRLAGYASEVVQWMRNFRFCGHCGTETERVAHERAKRCPSCGLMSFPRLSPAIIVAVTKGDQILLGHNKNYAHGNQFSTLAGFIEPGESAEEALCREVLEEVGVSVKNICYVTSQPWPFPDSLMLGYTAEYDSGEIVPDGEEILDARWFSKESIDDILIPSKQAVARTLIEHVWGPIDRE